MALSQGDTGYLRIYVNKIVTNCKQAPLEPIFMLNIIRKIITIVPERKRKQSRSKMTT